MTAMRVRADVVPAASSQRRHRAAGRLASDTPHDVNRPYRESR
ncbi:hypothetical protein [Streptomyces sp. YGL11-2]